MQLLSGYHLQVPPCPRITTIFAGALIRSKRQVDRTTSRCRLNYQALILANRLPVRQWRIFDDERWARPNLRPGADSHVIPVTARSYVRWRAVPGTAVARYNLIHNTNYDPPIEEIAVDEDVVCWQGENHCTQTLLGRSLVFKFH
jgi:hypothetical protein